MRFRGAACIGLELFFRVPILPQEMAMVSLKHDRDTEVQGQQEAGEQLKNSIHDVANVAMHS